MINTFLKYQTKSLIPSDIDSIDINKAQKILFSLFTRYGDTIIDIAVIQEFIDKYPNKLYLILCPKQMVPYIKALLPAVRVVSVNKRNMYDMIKIHILLKKEQFDIGFNPWSNGLDSYFFISYAKSYFPYKEFKKPKEINHYNIVREYLGLEKKSWIVNNFKLKKHYDNILICPESTDLHRSLKNDVLEEWIEYFNTGTITIAAMDKRYFRKNTENFLFQKSANASRLFLNLINRSDLVICVDSGPLHLSTILNKPTIGIFYSTDPEYVVNSDSIIRFENHVALIK